MTVDAGEPVLGGGEELRLAAQSRRELGATAGAAMDRYKELLAIQEGLPKALSEQKAESVDTQNEFRDADNGLFEVVNGALLSGAVSPEEALEYFM